MEKPEQLYFGVVPQSYLTLDDAQSAIINWIFSKHCKGDFILSIHDLADNTNPSTLIENLKWLGLDWKNDSTRNFHATIYQSKRIELYQREAWRLVSDGKAYACTRQIRADQTTTACTAECGESGQNDITQLQLSNVKPALYLRVDKNEYRFNDLVQGDIEFDAAALKDCLILHKNGLPNPNFAIAVDLRDFEISTCFQKAHRYRDSLEQLLFLDALNASSVQYGHISSIKPVPYANLQNYEQRHSIDYYRCEGYLPESLLEFLSTVDIDENLRFGYRNIDDLIAGFSFTRLTDEFSEFDQTRLDDINMKYMYESDIDKLMQVALPFFKEKGYPLNDLNTIKSLVSLLRTQAHNLKMLASDAELFFHEERQIDETDLRTILMNENSQKIYWSFLRGLQSVNELTAAAFIKIMHSVQTETGIMGKLLWAPIRIALTGKEMSCELPRCAELLGKEKCEKLIKNTVKKLQ
ncbi:hypothetical protein JXJ21_20745 [candidate division KSB1 bacterium]|nr:hypothetical protein [candidate division KSB1 bacterium]